MSAIPVSGGKVSTSASVRVRPAGRDDAEEWLRMRCALWPEGDAAEHSAEIERYFAGEIHMPIEVLIAFVDPGSAAGFAELSIRPYAEDCTTDRVAYLEGWYVEPHARRRGVGGALVRAAEEWGRAQGCTEFGSDAVVDNDVSAAAHLALGFQETVRIRCFRKTLAVLALGLLPALSTATPAQTVQYRAVNGVEYRSLPDTAAIVRAELALADDPGSAEFLLDLGLAQSAGRQYREAIETFGRAIALHPDNATLYRWRGHRYLTLRELGRARADLDRALALDSANYGALYHRGIVHYTLGEFARAAEDFARALPLAPNPGERAGTTDWLWMSLARGGRSGAARALIARRIDSLPAENAYARRLRMYRGEIGPDDVWRLADTSDVAVATLAYGVGNWYLIRGDTAQAVRWWFPRAIASGGWPAFGFIVAEAEVRRLQEKASPSLDSLAVLFGILERTLAPIAAARDSMMAELRSNPGSLRADTAYRGFREWARLGIRDVARSFDGPALQMLIYPDGMHGFQRRRRAGIPVPNPTWRDAIVADSIIAFMRARGVWTMRAEGDAWFVPHERWIIDALRPWLSPAGLEAGQILATEQTNPTAEDASIQISSEELASRVAATDRFIAAHPTAVDLDVIREMHRRYFAFFLGGTDNTPAFHRGTGMLDPASRAKLEGYAATQAGTVSGKAVQEYLELLRANGYRRTDAVSAYLRGLWGH